MEPRNETFLRSFLSFSVPQLLSFCLAACGQGPPPPANVPSTGPITIAVAGDTLLTRPIDVREAGVAAVRDLMSGATLAFANLNVNILEEPPAASGADTPSWPFARPRDAATLRDLGIDVVSLANDHATDYGAGGLASTRRTLARAGILDAGAGPDLAAARSPLVIGQSGAGRARVAFIALATSSTSASRATASRADIQGRAGLNPLRYAPNVTADPETFQTLVETAAAMGGARGGSPGDTISLFGTTIKKGARTAVEFVVDSRDEAEILEAIASARRGAEFVIVSVHSHEPANASAEPAEFVRVFARRAIDAGAHAIVGHGPHRLRGVEVYRGGIILYSLGDFVDQTPDGKAGDFDGGADLYALALGAGAGPAPPAVESASSLVALLDFADGQLSRVRVEPVDLGRDGVPRLADAAKQVEILEKLRALSAPDTRIQAGGPMAEVFLK